MAEPVLKTFDLPVEVEYGEDVAAQYTLSGIDSQLTSVTLLLAGKQTDCLAKDKCGVGGCDTKSGCC